MEVLLAITIPFTIVAVAVGISMWSFSEGLNSGKDEMKDAAVKSGHAEYYLDEKMEKQWRWK